MRNELIVKCAFNGESDSTQWKNFYSDSLIDVEFSRTINSNNETPNFNAYACDGNISINDKSLYLKKRLLSASETSELNNGMIVKIDSGSDTLGKFISKDMQYQYSQNDFNFSLDDIIDTMENIKIENYQYNGFEIPKGYPDYDKFFINGVQLYNDLISFTKKYMSVEFETLTEGQIKELSANKFYSPYANATTLKDLWQQFCIATMSSLYVNEENKLAINLYLNRNDRPIIKLTKEQYGQDAIINLVNKNNFSYVQTNYCGISSDTTNIYNLGFDLYKYNSNDKTYVMTTDFAIYVRTILGYLENGITTTAQQNAYNFKWSWKNNNGVELTFRDFSVSGESLTNAIARFAVEFTIPNDGILLDTFRMTNTETTCNVANLTRKGSIYNSKNTATNEDKINQISGLLKSEYDYNNYVNSLSTIGSVVITPFGDKFKAKVVIGFPFYWGDNSSSYQLPTTSVSISVNTPTITNETSTKGNSTNKNAIGLELPYSSFIREKNTRANPTSIAEKILNEYKNGRKTLTLKTSNFRFLSNTGAIVYTGIDSNILKVGDIIELEDLEDINFKITKITHRFEGKLELEIEAIEITIVADEGNVSFKIDDTDYSNKIPYGTTWEEAVTTYLSANYAVSGNYIINKSTGLFVLLNDNRVVRNEIIQAEDYTTGAYYKTFTIGNNTYKFEPNDTWEYWVLNTSNGFNTIGAIIQDNNVAINDNYLLYNGEKVLSTDKIVENANITLEYAYNQFTIGSVKYDFLEGQTWKDWLNSRFNTNSFSISIITNSLEQGANEGVVYTTLNNVDKYLATSSNYQVGYLATLNEKIEEKTYYWIDYFRTITIANREYKFEPTMSWRTWVKSVYSSILGNANSEFMVLETNIGSYIKTRDGKLFVLSGSSRILADSAMEEGTYITSDYYETFTLANIQYQFIPNTSWSEWVYKAPFEGINVGGYYIENNLVKSVDGVSIVTSVESDQSSKVLASDKIVANGEYYTVVPTVVQTFINFTIGGSSFTMPVGSTWSDFVEAYPNGYSEGDGLYVVTSDGKYVSSNGQESGKVKTKDSIGDSVEYYLYDDKIRFTIEGTKYSVEPGETWQTWAETTNGEYTIVIDPADVSRSLVKNVNKNSYVAYLDSTSFFLVESISPIETANYILDKYFNFFMIGDMRYKALPSQTWSDWVNSEYNTTGCLIDSDGYIYISVNSGISKQYLATSYSLSTRVKSTQTPQDVVLIYKTVITDATNTSNEIAFKENQTWGEWVGDATLNTLNLKKVEENDIIYIGDSSDTYYIINSILTNDDNRVKANDLINDYNSQYKFDKFYTTLDIITTTGDKITLSKVVLGQSWSSVVNNNSTILALDNRGYVILKNSDIYIFYDESRKSTYRVSSSDIVTLNETYYSGEIVTSKDISFNIYVLDSKGNNVTLGYTAQEGMTFYEWYKSVDYNSEGVVVYGSTANIFITYDGVRQKVENINGGTIITDGGKYTTPGATPISTAPTITLYGNVHNAESSGCSLTVNVDGETKYSNENEYEINIDSASPLIYSGNNIILTMIVSGGEYYDSYVKVNGEEVETTITSGGGFYDDTTVTYSTTTTKDLTIEFQCY